MKLACKHYTIILLQVATTVKYNPKNTVNVKNKKVKNESLWDLNVKKCHVNYMIN